MFFKTLVRTASPFVALVLASCASEDDGTSQTGATTTGSVPPDTTDATDATDAPEPVTTPTTEPLPATSTIDDLPSSSTDATTQSSEETGTSGPSEAFCGDGIVDPGEECDNSLDDNNLTGACLPACLLAKCGDGFVHTGVEECDMGPANGKNYAGCNDITCKWNSRCGDGIVDPNHEHCDPGDPGGQGDGIVPCSGSCRFSGRIAFLSSLEFDGNLGGLAGAGEKGPQLAATFDPALAPTYVAWLSGAGSPAISRLTPANLPIVLRTGLQVAASLDELVTTGPFPGIYLTDDDQTLTDCEVWTDTMFNGQTFESSHCEGWGSNDALLNARFGYNWLPIDSPDIPSWTKDHCWTSKDNGSCAMLRRLYCFENSPLQP